MEAIECRTPGGRGCRQATIELRSDPEEGERATITTAGSRLDPELGVGDGLRVTRNQLPPQADPATTDLYSLADFERRTPLYLLAGLFGFLVVVLGRARGALSLLGLASSFVVVVMTALLAVLFTELAHLAHGGHAH